LLPLYTHLIIHRTSLNNCMKKLNQLFSPIVVIMIIFLVVFMIQGCTSTVSTQKTQENESIKRSDTEFLCKKIDCGDEDVDDWPEVLDGIEITQERLDAAVEKMKPVSLMLVCMFAPEECQEE